MGLHTALDTSGVLGDRATDAATDLVLLDIKAIDPVLYHDLTGGSLMPTLRFSERLAGVPAATPEQVDAARAIFAAAGLNAP